MIMGVRIEQYTRGNGWNDGNEVRDQTSGPPDSRMDLMEA
jgi:hypothetical protein